MKSQILYVSMIFTISVLLMGTMFTVDAAKNTDPGRDIIKEETIKGNGVNIDQRRGFELTVNPTSEGTFNISYGYITDIDTGDFQKITCTGATDKIVKNAPLKKVSIVFNTTDKKLGDCVESNGNKILETNISIKIEFSGKFIDEAIDEDNGCDKDTGLCSITNGHILIVREGFAIITIGDSEPFELDGSKGHTVEAFKQNTKQVYWENPNSE